jgi:hypothetical protein
VQPAANRYVSRHRQGSLLKVAVFWLPPADASQPTTGWIFDRSTGGLRLNTGTSAEAGTRLRVRPCNAPESALGTLLQVRSCSQDGGSWILDCRFVEDATVSA